MGPYSLEENPPTNSAIIPAIQDWAELNYALLYCLQRWDCPYYLRPFIQAIGIHSQGRQVKITDRELSEVLGRNRSRVGRMRAEFRAWQVEAKCQIIDVTEHLYDPRKRKYDPTEYRFALAELLDRIVRRAREHVNYGSNWKAAIRSVARVLSNEVDYTPLWRARPHKRERSIQDQRQTYWVMITTYMEKYFDATRRLGGDVDEAATAIGLEARARSGFIYKKMTTLERRFDDGKQPNARSSSGQPIASGRGGLPGTDDEANDSS